MSKRLANTPLSSDWEEGRQDFSLDALGKRVDTETSHGTDFNEVELKSTDTKYCLIQLLLAHFENLKSHNVSALFSAPYNAMNTIGLKLRSPNLCNKSFRNRATPAAGSRSVSLQLCSRGDVESFVRYGSWVPRIT